MALRLRLSAPRDGLRWSTPEQWHITLQFYGDVAAEQAACLEASLLSTAMPGPELLIEELGHFPAKGILFVSVVATPSLLQLYGEVVQAAERCGFVPESRPFRPHITLARSKGRAGLLSLRHLCNPSLPSLGSELRWKADECLLIKSTLYPQGSEYAVNARVPLLEGAVAGEED